MIVSRKKHEDFVIDRSCYPGCVRVDVYYLGAGYFFRIGSEGCDLGNMHPFDEKMIIGVDMI